MKPGSPPVTASLGFGIVTKITHPRKGGVIQPAVKSRARILVVDSDPALRRRLAVSLSAANYDVETVSSALDAIDSCTRCHPHLVITDQHIDPIDGLGLLSELKARWPDVSVIIVTAHGTIPEAVRATQRGAFGFLVKPISSPELLGQVDRAIAASTFALVKGDWRASIVSRSQLMEDRLGEANRAARSEAPILLSGESGTGKELFARAIHVASARREKAFLVVRCRNLAEELLESQLFGSENDAGALRAARGGSVLLEDIDKLPLRLQKRLVEVLEKHDRTDAGRTNSAPVDARLICSTSDNLQRLVDAGHFDGGLYYSLNVLSIEVPPLGRRREDIPLLVSRFLEQASEGGTAKTIYSADAIRLLATTDWPGNVQQLFDLVKQNVGVSQGTIMTEELVRRTLGSDSTQVPSYDVAREEFSRDYLVRNLQSTAGNVSKSARLAKRNRTDFYKLLSRYRLRPDEYKEGSARTSKKGQ